MQTQWLTIHTADGDWMRAYYAAPDGAGPHPGIVVLQEAFGVNSYVRGFGSSTGSRMPASLAIAPELFHRSGAHVEVAYDDLGRRRCRSS